MEELMSSLWSLNSVPKEVTIVVGVWIRESKCQVNLPIPLMNRVIDFYYLQEHFLYCFPDVFLRSPFDLDMIKCSVYAPKLEEIPLPPRFRLIGNFFFGNAVEENLHQIVWELQYQSYGQAKFLLTVGVCDPQRACESNVNRRYRPIGPVASLYGENVTVSSRNARQRDNSCWCYGSFTDEMLRMSDWTPMKPITILAEIRNGMEQKAFVYLILGKEKICIGGALIEKLPDYQLALYVDFHYGASALDKLHSHHRVKLTNFRVTHGNHI